jgi:YhcH/YjgK/YiaL family protein
MILDSISYAEKYASLSENFAKAFQFMDSCDLHYLEVGKHEVSGDDVYVIIAEDTHNPEHTPTLEAHKVYADIQISLEGSFALGYTPAAECKTIKKEYDAENDYLLYADAEKEIFELTPGNFSILFPQDAHAPHSPKTSVKKAVFKVKL